MKMLENPHSKAVYMLCSIAGDIFSNLPKSQLFVSFSDIFPDAIIEKFNCETHESIFSAARSFFRRMNHCVDGSVADSLAPLELSQLS